nr:hypothetical protein [Tanacetum cinerariifolium]
MPPDSYSATSHFGGVTMIEVNRYKVLGYVDTIMSDSKDSTVTYTTALPLPDYVPGPEEPEQAPPSPVYIPYVPEPVYPEYIPPKDDVLPAEEQPLPTAASPTTDSPGYIPEDTWIDPRDVAEEVALTTLEGVNTRVTELGAVKWHQREGPQGELQAHDANRTGDDSHTSGTGVRRTERVTRECTYQDFIKCQPLYFKGTGGVIELTQWFERMEMVFRISNCLAENQVKFATCTLLAGALTWWNSHVRIVGYDAAYVMTWIELKKKMADKVKRYIGGLPDSIHGSVAASKPKTIQEATEMATGLMDKKIRTYAERQAANKRKFEDTSRNNQSQQQPPKRQDVARAYAVGSEPEGSTKGYPLVSVEVLRYEKKSKSENMGIVLTEMELILEHTQQGISHEVSVNAEWVEE